MEMVEKDFSLAAYKNLIGEVQRSSFEILTLRGYFRQKNHPQPFLILRHDVDRRPENALRMASLESSLGIHSTYYFRAKKRVFVEDIIRKIDTLGHEIGYHYEVMDKARGDIELAGRIFESELKRFRMLADVSTACMHGNPLSRWDNRDFWKYFPISKFHLVGEAYISIHDSELFYVTDTGRGWNRGECNLKDTFADGCVRAFPPLTSTGKLMKRIGSKKYQRIYLQIHPNRWSWRWLQWHRQWGEDMLANWVKLLAGQYYDRK